MNFQPPYHDTINKLLYAILRHFEGNPVNVPLPPYYNVTNRLLYEILQKLNTPTVPPVVYLQFRVLFVSARYGNDATAKVNDISKPYKTITAAKNSSLTGDMIHVMEGIYDEGSLSGNYNYWFDFKTEVNYSGTGAIFHQRFGECYVRGYGKFKCTGDANVINVGNWINCVLDIEAESFESVKKTVILWQNRTNGDPTFFKPHKIKARRAYSSSESAVHFNFNVHAEVEIEEIVSDTATQFAVMAGNVKKGYLKNSRIISNRSSVIMLNAVPGTLVIDNCEVICNYDSPDGHGFMQLTYGSDMIVYNTKIIVKHIFAKSFYTDFYNNLRIDNNVIANRDTGGSFPINYVNKGKRIQLENNEVTIDVTNLSSINLSGYQNAEIIRLTSTVANKTITEILNAPKHHSFIIMPNTGLSITINNVNPSSATDNSFVLQANRVVLNGSRGDWIEFQNGLNGKGNRQIRLSKY